MVIWGLEYCRLLALGLGWLEALQWRPPTLPTQFSRSAFGFGNLVPFESSLRWGALFWICGPRLLNVATGGVWDLFVLLPKILGCWGFFARAFLLGRLVIYLYMSSPDNLKLSILLNLRIIVAEKHLNPLPKWCEKENDFKSHINV